jgi:hypothetical protein
MSKPSIHQQLAQWRAHEQQRVADAPRPPPHGIADSAGFGIRLLARVVDGFLGVLIGLVLKIL